MSQNQTKPPNFQTNLFDIDGTLRDTTTPGQSEYENNGYEELLHSSQTYRWRLVSYPGQLFFLVGGDFLPLPLRDLQSVHSKLAHRLKYTF